MQIPAIQIPANHNSATKNLFLSSVIVLLSLVLVACDALFPPSPYDCEKMPEVLETKAAAYVLWRKEAVQIFETNVFSKLIPWLLAERMGRVGPDGEPLPSIKFWLRDDAVDNFTFSDAKRKDGAVIAGLLLIQNPHEQEKLHALMDELFYDYAAFEVDNSIPLDSGFPYVSGEMLPGLVSVSFFEAPKEMSRENFKQYWFCSHTPFALDIHPLWSYERNHVNKQLVAPKRVEGQLSFDAIVPLHLQHDSDIEFSRFFAADGNSPLKNALRIQSDVERFIDMDKIQTVPMRQFIYN